MGLFDAFKKKGIMLGAPMAGECVPLKKCKRPHLQ